MIRESAGQQVYAPAHEALFSAWLPLAEMIANRHDDLRLRSRLERRSADWRETGSGSSGLLSGEELDQAATWDERNPDLRTADITAYVAASTRRARRNRLLRIGVAAVVGLLALGLLGSLLRSRRRVPAARRVRASRRAARPGAGPGPAGPCRCRRSHCSSRRARTTRGRPAAAAGWPVSCCAAPCAHTSPTIGSTSADCPLRRDGGMRRVSPSSTSVLSTLVDITHRPGPSRTIEAVGPCRRRCAATTGSPSVVSEQRVLDATTWPRTSPDRCSPPSGCRTPVPVFSLDGALLATTSSNAYIALWSLADPGCTRRASAAGAHAPATPSGLAVLDDGTVLTVDDAAAPRGLDAGLSERKSRVVAEPRQRRHPGHRRRRRRQPRARRQRRRSRSAPTTASRWSTWPPPRSSGAPAPGTPRRRSPSSAA